MTGKIIPLELLAPARTADIGIEAIRHGADAVYIGAPAFGARAAATNSIDDIKRLVDFAHLFRAKVYVTVNTIIYQQELKLVELMIRQLHEIGVDALIVQDVAMKKMDIPPIPLHASTQMDNRTPEQVRFLHAQGYEQVVLARELSISDIKNIHEHCPDVKLEAFVHGALCVSYSGRCYVSQALFGRSANRGECAQVCRMEFDLENAKGEKLVTGKHLLSLKDMCRIDALEDMAEAGVSSFKIEGRLKDMAYVKNVTAAYSKALNDLVRHHPDRYRRASLGNVELSFKPDVEKSFNRGFTHYFLYGRNDDIFAFNSPKATGKRVGRVKALYTDSIVVEPEADKKLIFANGDGLCAFDASGQLIGFRVNRAEGNRLYLQQAAGVTRKLKRGTAVFRNFDKQFEDLLSVPSAERTIPVDMNLTFNPQISVFQLAIQNSKTMDGEENIVTDGKFSFCPELARTPQHDNIHRQLSKLGNTPLRLQQLNIGFKENFFIPSSMLAEWRRTVVERFLEQIRGNQDACTNGKSLAEHETIESNVKKSDTAELQAVNVANTLADEFYRQQGFQIILTAFEIKPAVDTPLMTCRHCIRYALGWCRKNPNAKNDAHPYGAYSGEPLFLTMQNGTRLALIFDCARCVMEVRKQ